MVVNRVRSRLGVFILGLVGVFVLGCGSVFLGLYETIVHFFMKKELLLEPGKEFFDIWKDLPIPVYQRVYLFNITNPENFVKHGMKPIVQEIGPYVFRGKWKKEDIVLNTNEGTLTYKDVKEYTFVPEMSSGTQDEEIYTLNGPLLGVINYVEEYTPYLLRPLVVQITNGIFEAYNESLLVKRTVRELVYDGYYEPMVEDLTKMIEPFVSLPLKLINNTFGLLHERRILGDGNFTVHSGAKDISKFGAIQKWNNKSMVDWWEGDHCNEIKGSEGIQFQPFLTKNETLHFFNPNLCRTMELLYERDITVHGIKTMRFSNPWDSLASPSIKPENKCFCTGDKCHISGIIPYSCKKGAPYVLSNPHYFEADPELQTSLVGIKPSADRHRSFVDIEPTTGFVLNGAFKLQLNGVVKRLNDYAPLKHAAESIVPVLWLSEEATLDVYFANYFKSRVQTPLLVLKVVCFVSIGLGALWTLSAACLVYCIKAKVEPERVKNSFVLKSLQSVYTSVALWPPLEEDFKDSCQPLKSAS